MSTTSAVYQDLKERRDFYDYQDQKTNLIDSEKESIGTLEGLSERKEKECTVQNRTVVVDGKVHNLSCGRMVTPLYNNDAQVLTTSQQLEEFLDPKASGE